MFLRQIDFLSPQITLYHKGFLYHSSFMSGILSIVMFLLIIIFSFLHLAKLWQREKESPKMSSYSGFIEDAGLYTINSSKFFHFISMNIDQNEFYDQGIDFTSFRIIGLDTYFERYKEDGDLAKFDHWLYGPCNNETDTQGISHLINQDYFTKSACIRKYFNSLEQKYYNTTENGFKWPIIAHGTFNPNNKFYNIFVDKCVQNSLDEINNNGYKCKNISDIEEILKYAIIHFNFIDEYVDIKKYKEPIIKYFYRVENKLDKDNFSINHLNFNPSLIQTHDGIILDKIKQEFSYTFYSNDDFVYNYYNDVYIVYYLWLNNRINNYERTYNRLQDIISNIGGTYEVIMTLFIFLNKIFNNYASLKDTEELLSSSCPFLLKEAINKNGVKFEYFKPKMYKNNKELNSIKNTSKENNNICTKSNIQITDSNKNSTLSKNENNCTFIIEKGYNLEKSDIP